MLSKGRAAFSNRLQSKPKNIFAAQASKKGDLTVAISDNENECKCFSRTIGCFAVFIFLFSLLHTTLSFSVAWVECLQLLPLLSCAYRGRQSTREGLSSDHTRLLWVKHVSLTPALCLSWHESSSYCTLHHDRHQHFIVNTLIKVSSSLCIVVIVYEMNN